MKIPSGGGVAFEVPGDDPDNPDVVKELTGVIVEHHPMNSYWADAYSGAGAAPDCASMDGKTGIVAATGECIDCLDVQSLTSSAATRTGRGKACKNLHRIYILRGGGSPAGHLQCAADVAEAIQGLSGLLTAAQGQAGQSGGNAHHAQKAQNAGGISYSQAMFSKAADLTPEQMEVLQPTIKAVREMARQVPVDFIAGGQR